MKLKREIAKLGRSPPNSGNFPSAVTGGGMSSASASPRASPRDEDSDRSEKTTMASDGYLSPFATSAAPPTGGAPIANVTDSLGNFIEPSGTSPVATKGGNGTTFTATKPAPDSDYQQTMYVLSTPDLGIPVVPKAEVPRQELKSSTSIEISAMQKLIIDTKIEICRVREEVSSQNSILKNELNDIKTKLAELTLLLKSGQIPAPNSALPSPPTYGNNNNVLPIRKKTSSELPTKK